MKKIDINIGDTFGDLTILEEVEPSEHGDKRYKCICKCGQNVIKKATVIRIIEERGNINSCGCRRKIKNIKINS